MDSNCINYPSNVVTTRTELQTAKLHLNSIISDVITAYMTIDINYYYFGTPIKRYEYIQIPVKYIPEDVMLQ